MLGRCAQIQTERRVLDSPRILRPRCFQVCVCVWMCVLGMYIYILVIGISLTLGISGIYVRLIVSFSGVSF